MTIERRHVGKRLSELVINRASGTIYLAGQVAEDPKADITGADAPGAGADRQAARRSRHRQDAHPVGDDLPSRHEGLPGAERRLGNLGRRRRDPCARHRRRRTSPDPSTRSRSRSSPRSPDRGHAPTARERHAAPVRRRPGDRRRHRRGATLPTPSNAATLPVTRAMFDEVMVPCYRARGVRAGARRGLARLGPGRAHVHRLRAAASPSPRWVTAIRRWSRRSTSRRRSSGTSPTGSPTSRRCGSRRRLTDTTFAERVFFCNSGAEANEAALKLARRYAHDRFGAHKLRVVSTLNAFHGRTLFTVTAGGQEKYASGFGPNPAGFVHLPYNDVAALEAEFAAHGAGDLRRHPRAHAGRRRHAPGNARVPAGGAAPLPPRTARC